VPTNITGVVAFKFCTEGSEASKRIDIMIRDHLEFSSVRGFFRTSMHIEKGKFLINNGSVFYV
jgi:hypothetical protein